MFLVRLKYCNFVTFLLCLLCFLNLLNKKTFFKTSKEAVMILKEIRIVNYEKSINLYINVFKYT